MSADPRTTRSRRALLAAGLAAGAATVAAAVTRVSPADAADGETMLVGHAYTASSTTKLDAGASGVYAIWGTSDTMAAVLGTSQSGDGVYGGSNTGNGVEGFSASGRGVSGTSTVGSGVYGLGVSSAGVVGVSQSAAEAGVLGQSNSGATGALGYSGFASVPAALPGTGVFGYSDINAASHGVRGESPAGVGVFATTTTGVALQVAGKAKFSRAGRASALKNKTYVDITVAGGLAANSVVSATLQTYRAGVAIAAVRTNYPVAGKARIYLTKVASTTAATSVGWFVAEY